MRRFGLALVLLAGLALSVIGTVARAQADSGGLDPTVTISVTFNPLQNFSGGLTIGGGTAIVRSHKGTLTHDFASQAAGTCSAAEAVTVTGALKGDPCAVGGPNSGALTAGSLFVCHITGTDTGSLIHCCNNGAAACDPASETYQVRTF